MIDAIGRLAAIAITAQVGGDHGIFLGQFRRQPVPLDVRLRMAVQEKEGRALSAGDDVEELDAEDEAQNEEEQGAARANWARLV